MARPRWLIKKILTVVTLVTLVTIARRAAHVHKISATKKSRGSLRLSNKTADHRLEHVGHAGSNNSSSSEVDHPVQSPAARNQRDHMAEVKPGASESGRNLSDNTGTSGLPTPAPQTPSPMTKLSPPSNISSEKMSTVIKVKMWERLYPGGNPYWLGRKDTNPFSKCKSKCIREENVTESDAVLISQKYLWNSTMPHIVKFKLPPRASYHQKWVFVGNEPPPFRPVAPRYYNLFNVTFTYKYDSDVHWAYGIFEERKKEMVKPWVSDEVWRLRKNNIAWESSHCNTSSRRELYVQELSKHIDVTIWGDCGTEKSPCSKAEVNFRSNKCYQEISQRFKFYLAFENSLCKDYLTEKIWRTLSIGLIPIVYGSYEYKAHLPDNSYIDVMDFRSPRHLAEHLRTVGSDRRLYNSYMTWRKTHIVVMDPLQAAMCDLCDHLHRSRGRAVRTVDLAEYWGEHSNCMSPHNFLQNNGIKYKE